MSRPPARQAALLTALACMWLAPPVMAQAPPGAPPAEAAASTPAPAAASSAPAPAGAASAPISEEERARRRTARDAPMRAQWQLIINAPDRLRDLLDKHLDVARFRSELASETTSLRELTRLVGAADR